jgi:glycosyltransferase involved in cell wall biosynthesis
MKLCIFTEIYQRGGIDTFIVSLVNAWPEGMDELTLFTNSENPFEPYLKERLNRQVRIIKYENRTTRQTNRLVNQFSASRPSFFQLIFNRIFEFKNVLFFPFLVYNIYKQLKQLNIERLLVVNGGYPGGINCRASSVAGWVLLNKNNVVFSFHNYSVEPKKVRRIVEAPIDFLVSRSTKTIVSVSASCLSSINNRYFLRSNPRRQVIFNGIEDPGLLNVKSEVLKNHKTEEYCVVIGSIEPRKGHDFLLDAFRYVVDSKPNVFLLIAGKGSAQEEERIAIRIKLMGLNEHVVLLGYIEDVDELIRKSSVMLVPSQSYESFGLTIIEAMARKVPVVATKIGGIPEVLGSNIGGIVCPSNDPRVYGLTILQFLEDKEFAHKVGCEGRLRFEQKFTSNMMALNYMNVLKVDLK